MATPSPSTRSTVVHELSNEISNEITAQQDYEPIQDIRTSVLEILHHIRHTWSQESQRSDGTTRAPHESVDKLHIVYSAAQILHRFHAQPDALPIKIVACLTKHIQGDSQVNVEKLEEILKGVRQVEMAQTKKIDEEAASDMETPLPTEGSHEMTGPVSTNEVEATSSGKKRKQIFELGSDEQISQPQLKKTKKSKAASEPENASVSSGGEQDSEGRTEELDFASSSVTGTAMEGSPRKAGDRSGLGNYEHDKYIKWYADEETFMRGLIVQNPKITYRKLAEAGKEKFGGTYYYEDGEQKPGLRVGRTPDALRQHFKSIMKQLRAAGNAAKGVQPGVDGIAPASGSPKKMGTGAAEVGGEADGRVNRDEDAPAETVAKETAHVSEADKSGPMKVYASEKVVQPTIENEGTADEEPEEPDEDDNPLADLEEMVAGVEEGSL